ncbi:MAG: glycosyltransferase family 4 protein [Candidatus Omnitrophica bacterium]|nr:glycosyltransferase family 4 protein [Candidatus Omnitrophota bacterium]
MLTICSPQLSIAHDAHLGGAVTDREFLCHLAKRGYHIKVLLPEGESYKSADNVEIIFLKRNMLLDHSYTANFFFLKTLDRVLSEGRVDILRVHSPYSIGIGASLLKTFRREMPPLWFSFLHLEKRWDWHILDKTLPFFADGITALSEDTMGDLRRRFPYLDKKITRVTPLGIDTDVFFRIENPVLHELNGIDTAKPIVLFVGSLIKRKGVDLLLESWPKIKTICPDAQLVIVGQGPSEFMITEYLDRYPDMYHVRFLTQERLVHYYSTASVFAFPSRKEGFGMVVGEAMSCGVPVVAFRTHGVQRLVEDGRSGYMVDPEDVDVFAEKVGHLIRHPEDAIQMGNRARRRIAKEFSWDVTILEVEQFMTQLLARRRYRSSQSQKAYSAAP